MSVAEAMHTTVGLRERDGKVGTVDFKDSVIENATGCGTLVVSAGAALLLLDPRLAAGLSIGFVLSIGF
jgi:hypothetical protein